MKRTRTTGSASIAIGAALFGLALLPACVPKAAHRQTGMMAKSGAVSMSAAELRVRVNDLANRVAGRIETTADRIGAETHDRAIRRRALLLKIDAIPAVYIAAYRTDPLVAALDVWAFSFQIDQYFDQGAGRDAFGPHQDRARDLGRQVLADADEVLRHVATTPERFTRARQRLASVIAQHPIEHSFAARPSAAAFMAEVRFEERDAFAAVGAVSDTVESLSEHLSTYAAQLPRQARWQAELLVFEMEGERGVEGTLGDIHALGEVARSANSLLGEVSGPAGAVSSARDLVGSERRALLEGVDRQRVLTLDYATAERLAVLSAVRDERVAVLAALHQERIESLKEADAIKTRAVDIALTGLRDLFNYAFWRVAGLLTFLMLGAAVLGLVAYRLTIGHRPAA